MICPKQLDSWECAVWFSALLTSWFPMLMTVADSSLVAQSPNLTGRTRRALWIHARNFPKIMRFISKVKIVIEFTASHQYENSFLARFNMLIVLDSPIDLINAPLQIAKEKWPVASRKLLPFDAFGAACRCTSNISFYFAGLWVERGRHSCSSGESRLLRKLIRGWNEVKSTLIIAAKRLNHITQCQISASHHKWIEFSKFT